MSQELEIQVIVTTHSPYLLSHHNPESNILLKRRCVRKKHRDSVIECVDDANWREPFELALGMVGPEFDALKNAFFSRENNILLVEGDIDVEYLELLRDNKHGTNKLNYSGEIYPYGGYGFLNNPVLINFLKGRFNKMLITLDYDAYPNVKATFEKVGLVQNVDFFLVGIDKAGYRFIEGLIPDSVREKVNSENSALNFALQSEKPEERKIAKNELKNLYLKEFKALSKNDTTLFREFYKLSKLLNKQL